MDDFVQQRDQIAAILARHRASNPRILAIMSTGGGSPARRLIEMVVDFEDGGKDPHNWGWLQIDLTLLFGCQVDIFTEETLPAPRREVMLQQARPLF